MRITDVKGVAPTNYKGGMLYMNKYRLMDILIMAGAFLWGFLWIILLLFVFVPNIYTFITLVVLIPAVAIALVQPLPNYHNNLEYLMLLIRYKKRCKHYSNTIKKLTPNEIKKKRENKKMESDELVE
jgi:hypothetical protein